MTPPICIFEDNRYSQLYPLALTRPVFDLRCGMFTLKLKIEKHFANHPVILFTRDYLKDLVQQENANAAVNRVDQDACLFINGRLILNDKLAKLLDLSQEKMYLRGDQVVAAYLKGDNIKKFTESIQDTAANPNLQQVEKVEAADCILINYPWDLVNQNPAEINQDFNLMNQGGVIQGQVSEHAILVNKNNIHIGKDSIVKPGAILDAEEGPIFIGEHVKILHNAVIEGPAYVGDGSAIKIAAKIYEGTSIGEVCKVGGEVEESIIHSYSNKQHDGFLGHAYLGQWVNLGADTNNSDLKNNYGNVKVVVNGKMVDSGSMFVGLFMGDHSKSGVNTMFNTGTVVGAACNVYGSGFPSKYIPSFSWGGAEGFVEHKLNKALETAQQVMARRKQELTPEYEKVFRYIFELTQKEREQIQK